MFSKPLTRRPQNPLANFFMGAGSGTLAATVCYPLDTVRRRMQVRLECTHCMRELCIGGAAAAEQAGQAATCSLALLPRMTDGTLCCLPWS